MSSVQLEKDIEILKTMEIRVVNGYQIFDSDRADLAGALARINKQFEEHLTDTAKLTAKLIEAGATREKVIEIVDGYGDAVDWTHHSLDSIVGEVWQSDTNSGDEPDSWIINEICRQFNIEEVRA